MAIVIVGMLDEREDALRIIKEQVESRGHKTVLVDISIGTGAARPSLVADVTCADLLRAAGTLGSPEHEATSDRKRDRERITSLVSKGLVTKVQSLYDSGDLDAVIAIGGMTGSLIALAAMKVLPFGVPKLLVSSTAAMPAHAEQLAEFFGSRDITVMHTVVDTVGMNRMVRRLAVNGANAISGMVEGGDDVAVQVHRRSIAISEFGFCDQGAHFIRERIQADYEVISFHATGLGDRSFVDLVRGSFFEGVIDLVPDSFSEWLLGGNRPSAEDRLDLARDLAIPYVFCPGGFDLISCGPIDRREKADPLWVTRRLAERKLHIQDALRVQARMNAEEGDQVAIAVAERLNRYIHKERLKVVIPERGFSSLSVESGPLHDPEADAAFVAALEKRLAPEIGVTKVHSDINSPEFARVVVRAFSEARKVCP